MNPIAATVLLSALTACAVQRSAAPGLSRAELLQVLGDDWVGTLTYRDYSDPDRHATLRVEVGVAATDAGVVLKLHYPDEPHADGDEALALSADGRTLAGTSIVARRTDGETIEVVTRGPGEDDGRQATIEHVYRLAPRALQVRKMVQLDGEAPFCRNEFRLVR